MKEKFNFHTKVRVRLPETDAFGIVFHGYFFTYFDVGRMDYLRNLDLTEDIHPTKGFVSVIVNATADFKSPARFDDELVVYVRVSEIGNSSFTFDFAIYHQRENRLVAQAKTVHCAIDKATWKPMPVPEFFREAIRKYEGAALNEKKTS